MPDSDVARPGAAEAMTAPAPAAAVSAWPIVVVIVGQVLAGVVSIITGISGIALFFMLGGLGTWGQWNGEWGGISGLLHILSAFMAIAGPIVGALHVVAAVGIHRRRRWARWLVLGLCTIASLQSIHGLFSTPSWALALVPGLALAIFSIAVLLAKPYATQFRRG